MAYSVKLLDKYSELQVELQKKLPEASIYRPCWCFSPTGACQKVFIPFMTAFHAWAAPLLVKNTNNGEKG